MHKRLLSDSGGNMLNDRHNKHFADSQFDKEIALAGNPNVGKSSLFNAVTGLKQHTGNWSGKTVSCAYGYCKGVCDTKIKVVDLPGVYSLKANSDEESLANDYVKKGKYDCIIIVVDATNLERNLNLVLQILKLTNKAVLCLNMWDEAIKYGIEINTDELSLQLGIPVVKTSAKKKVGVKQLVEKALQVSNEEITTYTVQSLVALSEAEYDSYVKQIYKLSSKMCDKCLTMQKKQKREFLFDKLLTTKCTGIPIMLLLLCALFWITIVGANYLSEILSGIFAFVVNDLECLFENFNINQTITSFLLDGVLTTLFWVVAVMLPPMAIFFPVFSLLEDSGVLPRIAFNLDSCFKKVGAHGKQSLTMAMGLGCNSCGVMGCRIINSKHEKDIAILTNSLIPCNGKLPSIIAITSIFITCSASVMLDSMITTLVLVFLIILSVAVTMCTSKLLSCTLLKGERSVFMMELPPYRKPEFIKTIIYSLKDKALFVLIRAIAVAAPAGALIWLMANIHVNDATILHYCTEFLEPFGKLLGLDGIVIMAFILGFPANETVIPIMLMAYTSSGSLMEYGSVEQLGFLLMQNGWDIHMAICFLVLCMFHFPCSTTCMTIYKETKSLKLTALSIVLPTLIGVILCLLFNLVVSI